MEGGSWASGLLTLTFIAAFVIGCVSLIAAFVIGCVSLITLYTLYRSGIQLGRAILLMGAVSIVGGTLYGLWADPKLKLHVTEWIILLLMTLFFIYRIFIKTEA
jgi:hypothetical protein